VTSKVLGLSYNSEGVLCVIYPLMASYYDIDLRAFKVGLDIIIGKNPVEPFDYNAEVRRIEPFEQLVDRLKQSQWPLLDLSLDFEQFQQNEFEVSFDSLFSELTTQIWQLFKNQNENTFLNVANLFSNNNSAWIPSLHDSATQLLRPDIDPNLFHLRLLKDDGVGLIERLAYVPLENIEHSSKFGRLTLLRYKFMLSLLNPQAKWKYFDILKAKDPRAFESLNELIFFIAGKVGPEKIKSFLSSYNANKRREAFQIFDNRLEQ